MVMKVLGGILYLLNKAFDIIDYISVYVFAFIGFLIKQIDLADPMKTILQFFAIYMIIFIVSTLYLVITRKLMILNVSFKEYLYIFNVYFFTNIPVFIGMIIINYFWHPLFEYIPFLKLCSIIVIISHCFAYFMHLLICRQIIIDAAEERTRLCKKYLRNDD